MSQPMNIPRVIYTFWHSKELPNLIEKCISTWRRKNPDYEIVILNTINYREYCSIDYLPSHLLERKENHTRLADYIRLAVLKEHGGIWMDSSTICTASLDAIIQDKRHELVLYASDFSSKYPVIESWFIACAKENEFIKLWYQEFVIKSQKFKSFKKYVKNELDGLDTSGDWWKSSVPFHHEFGRKRLPRLKYFAIHVAAQSVLQKQEYQFRNTIFLDANNKKNGPLNYVAAMQELCSSFAVGKVAKPIIKLTKNDRIFLEQNPIIEEQILASIFEIVSKKN